MKIIRKKIGFISLFMATMMLLIATPYQPLLAAMVPTEATLDKTIAQDARNHLKTLISRNDIKDALITQGIDPDEAKTRIDYLSDSEVTEVAGKIEQLPAGGGAFGAVIAASVIVFLVLLITDIIGYTDVFPFVKSQKK
jgi:hypothetical protein